MTSLILIHFYMNTSISICYIGLIREHSCNTTGECGSKGVQKVNFYVYQVWGFEHLLNNLSPFLRLSKTETYFVTNAIKIIILIKNNSNKPPLYTSFFYLV